MAERRKSYSEQLKDPRWQKKRLEILERDGWTCQECGSTDKTLHVHHWCYWRGRMPWEYEDQVYETVCEDCHEKVQARMEVLHLLLANNRNCPIRILHGFLVGYEMKTRPTEPMRANSTEMAIGIAAAFHLPAERLIRTIERRETFTGESLQAESDARPLE